MLEVSGYPIIYHQLMNLKKSGIRNITIIIGHLGNIIKDYLKDGKELGLEISYIEENPEKPLGTAGALYYLKERIQDDFIFLLADVFIDIDFNKMIDYHYDKKAEVTLFTHPNSHPFDSDLVVCDSNNKVISFDSKNNDRSAYNYSNLVNAGIMIFSKNTLNYIKEPIKYNYEKDIVIPLIREGKVYSYKSTEYAKDMGTPERYNRVQNDYLLNIPNKRNLKNKQKCIFLDRDGTINKYVGFLRKPCELELEDCASEAIKIINNSDYLAIVITNQPVIARGEVTVEQLNDIHKKMETLLGEKGAYIDDLLYCPHHPDKGFEGEVKELKIECECRKPNIGLILEAVKKYNIDLEKSFMIGDSTLDIECAKRAGITGILVKTGVSGSDNKFIVEPYKIEENLLDAVNEIIEKENEYGFQKSNKRILRKGNSSNKQI